jgi:hypothetical protein
MTKFGLPTTREEVSEGNFVELWHDAWLHGFTNMLLCRLYAARAREIGELMPWRDFLLAVQRGEFDYLLKDRSGNSFS